MDDVTSVTVQMIMTTTCLTLACFMHIDFLKHLEFKSGHYLFMYTN